MKKILSAESEPLALLVDINLALAGARNIRSGLQRALDILAQHERALQTSVVLKDPDSVRLRVGKSLNSA